MSQRLRALSVLRTFALVGAMLTSVATSAATADDAWVENVARALTPFIRTLPAETLVFNYTSHDRDLTGVTEPQADGVLTHVHHVISLVGSGSPEITTFGPGFYVALDPYASRMYGGSKFALFAVRLHEGFRYVRLDDETERYSQPFVRSMESRGCPMMSRYLKRQSISLAFKQPRCARIVLRAFEKLGVSGLAYPFKALTPNGCQGSDQQAFVLTNPDVVTKDDVLMLTSKIERADSDAGLLQRRIQGATPAQGPRVWSSLAGAGDSREWANRFLWNCREEVALSPLLR